MLSAEKNADRLALCVEQPGPRARLVRLDGNELVIVESSGDSAIVRYTVVRMRLLLGSIVAVVLLLACGPSGVEARRMLASDEPKTRAEGASALHQMWAKAPRSVGDHGETYWAERIARVRGRSASEAMAILEHPRAMGSEAGGGGATETYQLDDFWITESRKS